MCLALHLSALPKSYSLNACRSATAAINEMKACRACLEADKASTENRIILITDAQPNEGDLSEEGLLARLKANAADGIHTTIIGTLGQRGARLLCSKGQAGTALSLKIKI